MAEMADITYEQVAAAAQTLQDGGTPPSVGGLRAQLGPVSTQVLHQHLSRWRAAQRPPEVVADGGLPPALANALEVWVQERVESVARRLRADAGEAEADLASLLALQEEGDAERLSQAERLAAQAEERERGQAQLAEREAAVERLTMELRHARDIASEALVGKAKDQLAIQGKDAQIAELRRQLESQLAGAANESDARLAAEMELVGATTARDNLAAEVASLRAQLDALRAGSPAPHP